LTVLVLAAGKGKRLRSKTIKLLHPVAGRPMVAHLLDVARSLRPTRLITVIGHQADEVRQELGDVCRTFVVQQEQRGTGHAVLQAGRQIARARASTLLILNGDLPTLRAATLRKLLARHQRSGAALTLLSAEVDDPSGYGRMVRSARGELERIVEHGDASPAQRRIHEINCGIYCARPDTLLRTLRRLRPDNAQGEYYITDAVRFLLARGEKVGVVRHDDAEEVLGVNTRQELARASETLYARKAGALQDRGVTLLDASRTWIDPRARVGRDSVIYPGVIVEGTTVIGEDCTIYPGCRLVDSRVGRGARIKDHSVVLESRVGNDVQVGPFAHIRPGSVLEAGSRVGNFVELKKSLLGRGSKANHLTYLGDSTIGPACNIGAGTITCNYDGQRKHPTIMGRGVFIGSDAQLVAPVRLDDDAYVAAGTTVTKDVPSGALAIGRGQQRNIEGWVEKRRQKQGRSPGRGSKKKEAGR
jgi:bifunctional UDP-N-acetylglucosamine pyrophosphorylase/glucosamine-1-phosphate N-acetyltransferase